MDKYKFARLVLVKGAGVELYATSPSLIDWVQKTVKEMFPQCRQEVDKFVIGPKGKGKNDDFPRGQQFLLRMRDFKGVDTYVGFWLVDQLCGQGWEPFAANDFAQPSGGALSPSLTEQAMVFYFRREDK